MKRNLFYRWLAFLVLIPLLFASSCSYKEIKTSSLTPKITNPINLASGEIVINTYYLEVMRKEEINRVDLVAKDEKAPFYFDLTLLVDGIRYKLDDGIKGYSPQLTIADFDYDGLSDLKVTVKSGNTDNSIIFGLYHFQKREFKSMVSDEQKKGIIPLHVFRVSEKMIQIQSQTYQINVKKIINVPDLFDKKTKIGISDYLSLDTIDIDDDSKFELIGTQSIWVGFPFRKVYTFKTVLKWEQEHWKLLEYSFIENH